MSSKINKESLELLNNAINNTMDKENFFNEDLRPLIPRKSCSLTFSCMRSLNFTLGQKIKKALRLTSLQVITQEAHYEWLRSTREDIPLEVIFSIVPKYGTSEGYEITICINPVMYFKMKQLQLNPILTLDETIENNKAFMNRISIAMILKVIDQPKAKKEPKKLTILYESLNLHQRIKKVSGKLFIDGHYSSAIFESFKEVEIYVKEVSNINKSGTKLMTKAFDIKNPIIQLNKLETRTDKNEQDGFKFIFMGTALGIRNPKAHEHVLQKDPFTTLHYLSLASLLIKRVEKRIREKK